MSHRSLVLFAAHLLSLVAVVAFGVIVVRPLFGGEFAVFVGMVAAMTAAAKIGAAARRRERVTAPGLQS